MPAVCVFQYSRARSSIKLMYLPLGFAHKATKDIIWVGFYFVCPSLGTRY